MNSHVLTFIVIGQIIIFQFVAVALTRSVFTVTLGNPSGPLLSRVSSYLRKVTWVRTALGAALLILAMTSFLSLITDASARKILLTAVSLASTAIFAAGLIHDRRTVRSMRRELPDAGMKRASLGPRSIADWYQPSWEAVPIALLLATVVLTVIVGLRLGEVPVKMGVLQILQAAFVVGALLYTVRYGIAVPNVSSRLPMLRDRAELALEFGEQLAAREMRYFLLAKIGVTLLLGVHTIRVGLEALHHGAASVLDAGEWIIVAVLLLLFAGYVMQIMTLTRGVLRRVEQHSEEVNNQG